MEMNIVFYFVLGNHDYYFGSIINVREKIQTLCQQNNKLTRIMSLELRIR
jgi:hypothetical protein